MASPVDICNLALAEGATRTLINGFPPIENTPQAVTAGLFYSPKLQMLLRAAPWTFARRQLLLTQLKAAVINGVVSTNPPPQPWLYSYAYPADCLRARFLIQFQAPTTNGIPFTTGPQNIISPAYANTNVLFVIANDPDTTTQIPRKVILTNMANAMLVYTCDLSPVPDLWDPMFLAAATATLASYFIANLSGDKTLLNQQIQMAKGVLDSARGMNGSESLTNQNRQADWIFARMAGAGWNGWSYGNQMAVGNTWDPMTFPTGLTY